MKSDHSFGRASKFPSLCVIVVSFLLLGSILVTAVKAQSPVGTISLGTQTPEGPAYDAAKGEVYVAAGAVAPTSQSTNVPYLSLATTLANKLHDFMLNRATNAYYYEVSDNWLTVVTPTYSTLGNAFIALGLVQLYLATGNSTYLRWASSTSESFWRNGWDASHGGFYDTYSSAWKNTTCQQTAQPNALFEVVFLRLATANGSAVWLQRADKVEGLLNNRFWGASSSVPEQYYDVCTGRQSGDVHIEVSIGSYLWASAEWERYTSNSTFLANMNDAASFAEKYLWDGSSNTLAGGTGSTDCGTTNGYLGFMRSVYANLSGLEDCRKGANENVWGAMGLADLYNLTGSSTLLQYTNEDLSWINSTFWDPTNGGYHQDAFRNDTLRSACSSTNDPRDYPGWTEGEQPMFWWQIGQLTGNATEERWAGVAEQWTAGHQWNSTANNGGEVTCLNSNTLPDKGQNTLLDWVQGSALYDYSTISTSSSPPLSVSVLPVTVESGQAATLLANPSGGSGVYNYAWYSGACPPSGSVLGTASSYTTGTLTNPPSTDTFCVKVTDSLRATATANGVITVSPSSYPLTFSYQIIGGGSGYSAPVLTYTYGGLTQKATLGSNPAIYNADAGTTWSVSQPLPGSTASQRWETNQASTGTASSAITVSFAYYHQYAVTVSYTVNGGGAPTPPSMTCRRFGSASSDSLTGTPTAYWEDSSCSISVTNPISGAPGERWDTKQPTSGTVTGSGTVALVYYHQYSITFAYTVNGGGTPVVTNLVNYRQFGTALTLTPSQTGVPAWTDAGSTSTFSSAIAGGTGERWSTTTSSFAISAPVTEDPVYFHQYQVTFDYSVSDGSTPPTSGLAGAVTYFAFGVTSHDTPAKTNGPTDWVDAGTPVTYASPIYGSGTEKWQIAPTDTGTDTVISSVGATVTADPMYTDYVSGLRSTSTAVTASTTSETIGNISPVTFTVTVTDTNAGTPSSPTGTVTWNDGGAGGTFSSTTCALSPATSDSSTCAVTYTPSPTSSAGSIVITASYSGDGSHSQSSGSGSVTMNKRNTGTAITPSSLTVSPGTKITATVTVTDTSAGTTTSPTGTVTWKISGLGTTVSCTLATTGPGTSACTVTGLAPTAGLYTITATYNGDSTHNTSMGTSTLTVT